MKKWIVAVLVLVGMISMVGCSDTTKTAENLNEIWEKLDEQSFAAIHGSFIVNLKPIKPFSGGQVILADGTELTVSRGYKKSLTEKHIAFVRGGM